MLNCQDITHLLSESQERKLTLHERMSLKMHVLMCSGCRNFGRHMHTLRQAARAYTKRHDEFTGKTDE